MEDFGIKDVFDILIVAILLYYLYKIMKESGTLNIFYGVMAFICVWIVGSEILDMKLLGTILDTFMSVGLIILVIIFQDQIKRFLIELGSHRRWQFIGKLFHTKKIKSVEDHSRDSIMPIVYASRNMAKRKEGALIVIEQQVPLDTYENTGDELDADINSRLIETIFFKNSPLHDGAMIIAKGRINAAGCILPVSHDTNIPRSLGLRHRSALGMSQATDAFCIIVSEETGKISIAHRGHLEIDLTSAELEQRLSDLPTV